MISEILPKGKFQNIVQCPFNYSSNLKILLQICETYICDYLSYTSFLFHQNDFQLTEDFDLQFCIFTVKSSSATQISVSQENGFRKSKGCRLYFTELSAQIILQC